MLYSFIVYYEQSNGSVGKFDGAVEVGSRGDYNDLITAANRAYDIAVSGGIKRITDITVRLAESADFA